MNWRTFPLESAQVGELELLMRVCELVGTYGTLGTILNSERGGNLAWGFHESPSYPHMYCFLACRERIESYYRKYTALELYSNRGFLNLGRLSHECQ
jgi:hypothetical protein